MKNLIKNIYVTSKQITDNELDRLTTEEMLLTKLVRCNKVTLEVKTEAFKRIEVINRKQLQILGSTLK